MKTRNRIQQKNFRALTPMQLDTLTRVFYGEFHIVIFPPRRLKAPVDNCEFRDAYTAQVLTERMRSLYRRRLIQNRWMPDGNRAVYVTPKGILELEKHPECTLHG